MSRHSHGEASRLANAVLFLVYAGVAAALTAPMWLATAQRFLAGLGAAL